MLITNTILGIFMMIVFCILLGSIFSWLYLNTKSPWVAALGHGSVNAVAGLLVLFFQPEFNMALGDMLASPVAWIGMGLFLAWLIQTKRLPMRSKSTPGCRTRTWVKQLKIRTSVLFEKINTKNAGLLFSAVQHFLRS